MAVRVLIPTQAQPALSVKSTHAGNFVTGQIAAAYTVTVANSALAGATTGMVTVSETLPSSLTAVSMTGSGWTCQTITCSRSDSLAAGASYPPITVTVKVTASAPSQLTNSVLVSGGGSFAAGAEDLTVVMTPSLSISKTHVGSFAQGQNGATYSVVVSNAGTAGPTSGTVTVTEIIPSGLTLVSMSGMGWTCPSGGKHVHPERCAGCRGELPGDYRYSECGGERAGIGDQPGERHGRRVGQANASDTTTILRLTRSSQVRS